MKKINNLSVLGIGRLGLCFSLNLEESGYNVVGCDINQKYVNKINSKTFTSTEPGVNEMLKRSNNFFATCDIKKTVEHANNIFVTVASYSEPDGKYDVSQVEDVVQSLVDLGQQKNKKHLIICTNVNPGYTDTIYERLKNYNWTVSFNPETIAQGTIVKNQKYPDCIYIGSTDRDDISSLLEIYANVCANSPSIHVMDRLSAELTKVSLNCFLTCKISFANMVGDLALKIGADPDKVLKAVGSDSRINNKFFKHGFGWGGPCFPRDTRAYIRLSIENDMPFDMCMASNSINQKHLDIQVKNFVDTGKESYQTDSVTYKKGTTILEESQQLKFAIELAKKGVKVTIKEQEEVIKKLKEQYGGFFNYE